MAEDKSPKVFPRSLPVWVFIVIALVMLSYPVQALQDNLAMLEGSTVLELEQFEKITGYTLEFTTVAKADIQSQDSFDDALRIYDNITQDFLIYYSKEDGALIVVQPLQNIIPKEKLDALMQKVIDEKEKSLDDGDLNVVFRMLINELALLIHPNDQAKIYCESIKDGVCDPGCPGKDIDCFCGDGICQQYEIFETCPADCKQKKEYLCAVLRDNECNPNCPVTDIDCTSQKLLDVSLKYYQENENKYPYIITALGILTFILIGVTLYIISEIYKVKL